MSKKNKKDSVIEEDLDNIIGIDSPQIISEPKSGNPFEEDLEVIIYQSALEEIKTHGASNLKNEIGGVMLGEVYKNEEKTYVEITNSIPALEANTGIAHVEFTNKTWEGIEQERAIKYQGKKVVGWYHTHPGLGLFMSLDDIFIHTNLFHQPWHIALVVDPINENYRFFRWKDEEVVLCPIFSIRIKGEMPSKESISQQILHCIKSLERTLDFESNCDNLKKTLTSLQKRLVKKPQERYGYFGGYDFLKVITFIAKLNPLAIKEAKTILKKRVTQIRLSMRNTQKYKEDRKWGILP